MCFPNAFKYDLGDYSVCYARLTIYRCDLCPALLHVFITHVKTNSMQVGSAVNVYIQLANTHLAKAWVKAWGENEE